MLQALATLNSGFAIVALLGLSLGTAAGWLHASAPVAAVGSPGQPSPSVPDPGSEAIDGSPSGADGERLPPPPAAGLRADPRRQPPLEELVRAITAAEVECGRLQAEARRIATWQEDWGTRRARRWWWRAASAVGLGQERFIRRGVEADTAFLTERLGASLVRPRVAEVRAALGDVYARRWEVLSDYQATVAIRDAEITQDELAEEQSRHRRRLCEVSVFSLARLPEAFEGAPDARDLVAHTVLQLAGPMHGVDVETTE